MILARCGRVKCAQVGKGCGRWRGAATVEGGSLAPRFRRHVTSRYHVQPPYKPRSHRLLRVGGRGTSQLTASLPGRGDSRARAGYGTTCPPTQGGGITNECNGRIRAAVSCTPGRRWRSGGRTDRSVRVAQKALHGHGRGDPAERLAWPGVEFGGDLEQPLGRVHGQVGALGEVLAQEPLVFSLLPRCQGLCGSQK